VNGNQAFNIGGIDELSGAVKIIAGSQVDDNLSTSTVMTQNGDFGGGGIAVKTGSVYVSQSEVSYNHSVGMYSAGIVILLGDVTITRGSSVDWNRNNGPGGRIAANFSGTVTVSGRSQVDHNTGGALGGGIVNFSGPRKAVVIEGHSEVKDNILTNAESLGETILVFLQYIAILINGDFTTLTDGVSPDQARALIRQVEQEIATGHGLDPNAIPPNFVVAGGGIGTLLGAPVIVSNGSSIAGNNAGLRVDGGNPNSVGVGGGVVALRGRVVVDESAVLENAASEDGGGIWSLGNVSISRSTVAGNNGLGETLGSIGGGLFVGSLGQASIRDSSLEQNHAEFGGGVYNLGSLGLVGSLVTRNRAAVRGGGIANQGRLTLHRSQVVFNTPDNIAR
jgi:hypothetical protein